MEIAIPPWSASARVRSSPSPGPVRIGHAPATRGIAEFSVYVERTARGTGAGYAILTALIHVCEHRGFWKLVSRIFPENTASRALCRRAGFREVGIYERHGQLDGEWRDCVIVERLLGEARQPERVLRGDVRY